MGDTKEILTKEQLELLAPVTHPEIMQEIRRLHYVISQKNSEIEGWKKEFFDCPVNESGEPRCRKDFDGHGGRIFSCRVCPYHPLRAALDAEDPQKLREAVKEYLK